MVSLSANSLVIAECGFGFGLNFLVTCEHFCRLAPKQATLHYLSCEIHPVLIKDIQRFYKQLPTDLVPFADKLVEIYPEQGKGTHRLNFHHQDRHIILDLLYDEAFAALESLSAPPEYVDVWYLDGHAPSKNQEMWDLPLCNLMARLSKPAVTTLSTYSVAGVVRRNLKEAGFDVEKSAGFGNKRQMLIGQYGHHQQATENSPEKVISPHWSNPWMKDMPACQNNSRHVGIIGAGLAGCATAYALANRGYKVTLIEKNYDIASAASGNPRGIVHFNPGRELTDACLFRLNAFNYANRHYRALAQCFDFDWDPCGLLQIACSDKEISESQSLSARKLYPPDFIKTVTAEQASVIANLNIAHEGLFFPQAGILNPAGLCSAWISHDLIQLLPSHHVDEIQYCEDQWQVSLTTLAQHSTRSFDVLVICNNNYATKLSPSANYPIISNHGQTDSITRPDNLPTKEKLKTVIRHQGYVIPWQNNSKEQLTLGGSFAQGEQGLQEAREEMEFRKKNLNLIQNFPGSIVKAFKDASHNNQASLSCRIGTRCTTPDYLPLAGPVENISESENIFSGYQRNAKKEIAANAEFLPDLYINVAHGSSGLITTPILAETIASLIDGNSLPLPGNELEAVLPLRYLIRNLKRQKKQNGV